MRRETAGEAEAKFVKILSNYYHGNHPLLSIVLNICQNPECQQQIF